MGCNVRRLTTTSTRTNFRRGCIMSVKLIGKFRPHFQDMQYYKIIWSEPHSLPDLRIPGEKTPRSCWIMCTFYTSFQSSNKIWYHCWAVRVWCNTAVATLLLIVPSKLNFALTVKKRRCTRTNVYGSSNHTSSTHYDVSRCEWSPRTAQSLYNNSDHISVV